MLGMTWVVRDPLPRGPPKPLAGSWDLLPEQSWDGHPEGGRLPRESWTQGTVTLKSCLSGHRQINVSVIVGSTGVGDASPEHWAAHTRERVGAETPPAYLGVIPSPAWVTWSRALSGGGPRSPSPKARLAPPSLSFPIGKEQAIAAPMA